MRSIGFFVKNGVVKEVLPKSYKMMSKNRRRKMFFAMLNLQLSKEARVELNRCSDFDMDIRRIAFDKVLSFFQCYKLRPETAKVPVKILVNESILFDKFFKSVKIPLSNTKDYFDGVGVSRDSCLHPALELINLLFIRSSGALFDLDKMFAYTVFRRIKPTNTAMVTMKNGCIHIDDNGVRTRVCPRWKRMSMERLFDDDKHITDGIRQLDNDKINACYLVYPKMDDFTKHIIVEHSKEGFLKVIPYSFTFCDRADIGA